MKQRVLEFQSERPVFYLVTFQRYFLRKRIKSGSSARAGNTAVLQPLLPEVSSMLPLVKVAVTVFPLIANVITSADAKPLDPPVTESSVISPATNLSCVFPVLPGLRTE